MPKIRSSKDHPTAAGMRNNRRAPSALLVLSQLKSRSQRHTWPSTMSPLSPGSDAGSLLWDMLPSALLTQNNLFANLAGHAGIWRLVYLKWFRTTSGLKFPLFTNLSYSQGLRTIIPSMLTFIRLRFIQLSFTSVDLKLQDLRTCLFL